jgi:hypothetical protein
VKVENLVTLYRQIEEKLKILKERKNSYTYPSSSYGWKPKSFWKSSTVLTINGVRVEVDFNCLNTAELNDLIDSHRSKIEKERESINELKARAASKELETRQLAQSERRKLITQLSILDRCPYCADPLSINDAHLDHRASCKIIGGTGLRWAI